MDPELSLSLIGSGVGTILALALCRLFDCVRRTISEPVAVAGVVMAGLTVFVGLFRVNIMTGLFFPFVLLAGIVSCQRRDPAKNGLTAFCLFGILIIELLSAVLALCLLRYLLPQGEHTGTLMPNAATALFLTVLAEEAFGHLRRRMTLR